MRFTLLTFILAGTSALAHAGMIEQKLASIREQMVRETSAGAKPKNPQNYNELAQVLVRRARQTADPQYCDQAETAADASLKIDPKGFDGQKAHAMARLCQKRWGEARVELAALNKRVPDDIMIWGYLADVDVALGNYESAEKEVQIMLDLRQVNPPGLQRGAVLRELFGFNNPSLEWWNSALRLTSTADSEERAWILAHIAHIFRILGKTDSAESTCRQALEAEANNPWSLQELGRAQFAAKKFSDAVKTFAALRAAAPREIGTLFELGRAQEAAGALPEAQRSYADFEKLATAAEESPANANVMLVLYYAGPGHRPADAVSLAQKTLQHRHDVEMLEAYAQALAAKGEVKAAEEQMAVALKPGIQDPAWLLEAGRFARQAGDFENAHKYFQKALEAAPASPLTPEIIQALSSGEKPRV